MEIKDWITIGSVTAVIVGWFINGYLNRRHEIFKRKMDLRFKMYDSCISVAQVLEKIFQSKDQSKEAMDTLSAEFMKRLDLCQVQVLMYGTQSEIDAIIKVVELAQSNKHGEMKNAMAKLMRSVSGSLRRDLKLKKVTFKNDPQ
jgi:hypothetical protein